MLWSLIQHVGGQGLNLLTYLLLARLLTPADFGLVGLATVWTALLSAFAELGFGAALVQRRSIDPAHASSTFTINLAVGVALAAAGLGLSIPAASLVGDARLQPVLAALSLGFILRAVGLTHVALAQRELRFRALAIRDLVANTVAGATGIVLALRGAGVWSLVAVSLISAAMGSALLWRLSPWRPVRTLVTRAALADLWGFSANILGFNLFKALAQNVDRLVVGQLFGTAAAGYYTLAGRIVLHPIGVVVGALGTYLFPTAARAQDEPATVAREYRRVLKLAVAATVPVTAAAGTIAVILVPWILGDVWRPAGPLLGWLGLAALCRAFFSPAGQLLKAVGRPGLMLAWSVGITALTVGGLYAGAPWGLPGLAAGFAIAHVVGVPVLVLIVRRPGHVSGRDHATALAGVLALGVALWGALWLVGRLVPDAPALVLVGAGLSMAGFAVAVLAADPELRALSRRRVAQPPPDGAPLSPPLDSAADSSL